MLRATGVHTDCWHHDLMGGQRRKRAKGEWVAKRMARLDMIEVPLIEVPGNNQQT
jgi:hypothetical protein